jgi:tripartite ATP-independent transporter DctM subunit
MDFTFWLPLAFLIFIFTLLFAGYSVAFTLAGGSLLFAGGAAAFGQFEFRVMQALTSRIYNLFADDTLISVPVFVLMGTILDRTKVAADLLEAMGLALRRIPGGIGVSVCLVGALLGASTGVIGATVVTMALISLPTMLRHGYPAPLACGLICASGALTQVIPPATVLILLGDQIGNAYGEAQRAVGNWAASPVSVVDLYAGALLPGLLLVAAYSLYVVGYATLRPTAFKAAPDIDIRRRITWNELMRALVAPIGLLVAVLGSILFGIATPTEGAGVGVAGAILLAGARHGSTRRRAVLVGLLALVGALVLVNVADVRLMRGTWKMANVGVITCLSICIACAFTAIALAALDLWRSGVLMAASLKALEITGMVYGILLGASFFSLVFYGLGGDQLVAALFKGLPGGSAGAMIFSQVVIFVLGFPLENTEIISIAVPILAPSLLQTVDPIWFGVVTAVNLQTSYISPPVGFALFYLRNAVPSSITTAMIWKGAVPFLFIQIAVLALLIHDPRLATWLPTFLPR